MPVKIGLAFCIFLCSVSGIKINAQNAVVPVENFSAFKNKLHNNSDSVFIINFWATWCAPCRKELPVFEKINKDYSHLKVNVLLVSLDFPNQAQRDLKDFLFKNQITTRVVLLNDPDANAWIDQVDPSWSGSLPATLIYKRTHRLFFEKELTYQDIANSIHSLITL